MCSESVRVSWDSCPCSLTPSETPGFQSEPLQHKTSNNGSESLQLGFYLTLETDTLLRVTVRNRTDATNAASPVRTKADLQTGFYGSFLAAFPHNLCGNRIKNRLRVVLLRGGIRRQNTNISGKTFLIGMSHPSSPVVVPLPPPTCPSHFVLQANSTNGLKCSIDLMTIPPILFTL